MGGEVTCSHSWEQQARDTRPGITMQVQDSKLITQKFTASTTHGQAPANSLFHLVSAARIMQSANLSRLNLGQSNSGKPPPSQGWAACKRRKVSLASMRSRDKVTLALQGLSPELVLDKPARHCDHHRHSGEVALRAEATQASVGSLSSCRNAAFEATLGHLSPEPFKAKSNSDPACQG